ncbi:hypothetical protein BRAO375_1800003 [Bradyrhizobium sp. ORS 375]|nr:hypothetical protein BRAO375_1800003 [Bradyrhizobium sp. ORS 375]
MLNTHWRTAGFRPSEEQLRFLDLLARQAAELMERRRTESALSNAQSKSHSELERQVQERTAELQASRDLLQGTMDSSPDMVQVFEAIRDQAGDIIDFRWLLNNHTSETRYGEVRGESLLQRNPGVLVEGIFDAFKRVTETGVPEQAERHYVHEQFDGWFYQSVVKLGDGVATTTRDITDWKRAQSEVLRLQDEVAQASCARARSDFACWWRVSATTRSSPWTGTALSRPGPQVLRPYSAGPRGKSWAALSIRRSCQRMSRAGSLRRRGREPCSKGLPPMSESTSGRTDRASSFMAPLNLLQAAAESASSSRSGKM